MLQLATGAGKTKTAADIVKAANQKGKRVYWLCHRKELVEQASGVFFENEIPHGLIVAGHDVSDHSVQVASIQTLARRLDKVERPDLIIYDEAHHLPSKTWASIYKTYKNAFHLGLTATPVRLDGKGLGEFFTHMVKGPSVQELISMGHLVPAKHYAKQLDLKGVKITAGDFNKAALSEAMGKAKITGNLIDEYREKADGKKMVVFAPTIKFCEQIVEELASVGIRAAMLDGTTEKGLRTVTLELFKRGGLDVLVNVELFTEGFDCPDIEAVAMLRPTQSTGLYLQMLGRLSRPAPGKKEGIVLDLAGNGFRHGLYDDDREWSLDMDVEKEQKEKLPSLATCEVCMGAFPAAAKVCPYCGSAKVAKQRVIRTEKGRLVEMKRMEKEKKEKEKRKKAKEKSGLDCYADALKFARKQGYKAGWVDHYATAKGWLGKGLVICGECDGHGETMDMECYGGPPVEVMNTCETCDGSGTVPMAGEPAM